MDHDPSPGDDAATLRARLAHAIANLPEALRACAPDALANRVAPIFAEDDHERCAARARRAPAPQHHRSITTAPSSYTPRGEDPKKSATTIHPSRPLAAAHAAAPPSRRLTSPPKKQTPARARPRPARVPPAPSLPSSRERDWVAALGAPTSASDRSAEEARLAAAAAALESAIAAADDPTPSREKRKKSSTGGGEARESFAGPSNRRREDVGEGLVACAACGRVLATAAVAAHACDAVAGTRAPRTGDEAAKDKHRHSPPSANSPGKAWSPTPPPGGVGVPPRVDVAAARTFSTSSASTSTCEEEDAKHPKPFGAFASNDLGVDARARAPARSLAHASNDSGVDARALAEARARARARFAAEARSPAGALPGSPAAAPAAAPAEARRLAILRHQKAMYEAMTAAGDEGGESAREARLGGA
jgi:hypothetical protein